VCGIAGCVWTGASREAVERQVGLLCHRGPDSLGIYQRSSAFVGQTRLSVIDLVTGDPPIANEDGRIGVALNGEIYNFAALREELKARGHELSTRGDTEVLAHLAEDLDGPSVAERLHGMFAFAIWDDRRQRLLLGRDRFGKKPLYYWRGPSGEVVFGSEIKSVLAHPAVPREVDPEAIPAHLCFGYVPAPRTFYAGIYGVMPGHVMTFTKDEVRSEAYWEPRVRRSGTATDASFDEAAAHTRELLQASVEARLVSDVPLGAFLSGGIDSSVVVALMSRVLDRPVKTFTIGFEDAPAFDERNYARLVANRYATDHTELVVKPHAVDLVEKLVWHHDQPFGDSSAIPTYLLCEMTKQHVTVALSGDGGDELFAGYRRFLAATWLPRFRQIPGPLRRMLGTFAKPLKADAFGGRAALVKRFLAANDLSVAEAYLKWLAYVPPERMAELVYDDGWALQRHLDVWNGSEGAETLMRLLHLNLQTYLLDDLLPKVDRMSMAHGLEVRSPFLDAPLADFVLGLPASFHIQGGTLKRLLRAATDDLVPAEIMSRGKQGFGVPLDSWFRGELADYMESMLASPTARVRSVLKPDGLDALLGEQKRGERHGQILWALLTLEIFLRKEQVDPEDLVTPIASSGRTA
jgi:asparagine synthase (glutamine-hydrolysing)